MIDLSKYSEKEIVAAIKVVEEILDVEDFNLDVNEYGESDDFGGEVGTELFFNLIDRQGAYLGDIGLDVFSNLAAVIDRTDTYHNDSFYNAYEERVNQDEDIPRDDWDRKILIFLESDYVSELLSGIDVETYQKYKGRELNSLKLTSVEQEKYVTDGRFDAVGYLCDKFIAMEILETESAYLWFEHEGRFYLSEYGADDIFDTVEDFKKEVLNSLSNGVKTDTAEGFWTEYGAYSEVINAECGQIQCDMRDIGLYDGKDNWQFYLSEYELEYVGLGEEKDKLKKEFEDIKFLSENDISDETMERHLESIVIDAKNRANANNGKANLSRTYVDKEME